MTKQNQNSLALGSLLGVATILLVSTPTFADGEATAEVTVNANVTNACALTVASGENVIEQTVQPGTPTTLGTSHIQASCNDTAGLAVYAVGFTNNEYGNTVLSAGSGSGLQIPTGAAASPTASQWNMTIANNTSVQGNDDLTVENGFGTAHVIPSIYTKILSRNSAASSEAGANFTATFNIFASNQQLAGTYEGKVKFLLVHPNVLSYNEQTGDPATYAPNTLSTVTVNYGTGVSSVTIGGKVVANGGSIALTTNQSYDIDMTPSSGYEFASWATTGGSLGSASTKATTLTVTTAGNATLTATAAETL